MCSRGVSTVLFLDEDITISRISRPLAAKRLDDAVTCNCS